MLNQLNHLGSVFIPLYCSLNPDFNCSKSFLLFSVNRVTTGTYNFVCLEHTILCVISNFNLVGAVISGIILAKTQFLDQVKFNSI